MSVIPPEIRQESLVLHQEVALLSRRIAEAKLLLPNQTNSEARETIGKLLTDAMALYNRSVLLLQRVLLHPSATPDTPSHPLPPDHRPPSA